MPEVPERPTGRRLQRSREELGVSVDDLAALLGVTPYFVGEVEQGKYDEVDAQSSELLRILDLWSLVLELHDIKKARSAAWYAELTFGEFLGDMLVTHQMSVKEFASAIHVDGSLVRRWLRDERTPSMKSEHVQQIVNALGLTKNEAACLITCQKYSRIVEFLTGDIGTEIRTALRWAHLLSGV